MKIAIIVAMDENGGIGVANRLPWRLSSDLRRFKALTMGHHLLLGRKTYQSIGRPLPGRKMLVLSQNPHFQAPGCQVVHSLDAALELARQRGETELFIGGGAKLYHQILPLTDCIYLTLVHTRAPVDTYFPPFERADWHQSQTHFIAADERNAYDTTFTVLSRRNPPD